MQITNKVRINETGEEYSSYYDTIVQSDIWQQWADHQREVMEWDIDESIECGWLSPEHWNAFIRWLENGKIIK